MSASVYTLGVITCHLSKKTPPFQEAGYIKELTAAGVPFGIQLITFSPMDVDWKTRKVSAWRYDPKGKRWHKESHPIPHLIYDRCYYLTSEQYAAYKPYISRISKDSQTHLLGRPLGGKLHTHHMIQENPALRPYLPPTIKLQSSADILTALQKHAAILIKPNGGSHGRGVAAIIPEGDSFRVWGRSKANRRFHLLLHSRKTLCRWAEQFTQHSRYIIQPYLSLTTMDGRPFDIRILVQKDRSGCWVTTGMAVRTGHFSSLTSNLHGGGHAERAIPFLKKYYPPGKVSKILKSIRFLSLNIPKQIESQHGRLLELGLDIGVDRNGHVWLLEANSKPGRSIFLKTGEQDVRVQSVRLPIEYAHSLFQSLTGGSV
ncbi:YheC/YheD family protein [Melghirimyces algeriensis]|uniref:YheC/D like ATP-grasp n=1 Tax=Melghirimyces algeriensis TaxID=910412 RepID=A0A521AE13_9BACL|nr:YheC/YheD family protein [Melghirimyces algeriensis]SMO33021.1 YheC/D like ATP-grasp [Melghirimyces algeriensis]